MSFDETYDFQNTEDFQELDSFLEIHDLWRKPVPRDNQSLFRCISEHIYGTQCLYPKVKKHFVKFVSNNFKDTYSSKSSAELDTQQETYIDLKTLSNLYLCKFQIVQQDNPISIANLKFSQGFIPIVQCEANHFDLILPRLFREDLAFIQSMIYTILYKMVFQIDIPFSLKDFTLQSIRETYFIKQDVYEFSHLERCLNSFYFEDLEMRCWKSQSQNCALTNLEGSKSTVFVVGDVVKVFSPNTDNKPYYLAKIVKLFVTPGMHEVLAPNRGTELVDIGHLKPTSDKEGYFNENSMSIHHLPSTSSNIFSASVSPDNSIFSQSISCIQPPIDSLEAMQPFDTNTLSSVSSNSPNLSKMTKIHHDNLITKIPPGFDEIPLTPTPSKSLVDNESYVFASLDGKLENLSIKAPKHKYGPQSAAVKHKFIHDSNFDSKTTLNDLKPFEQISENAHSQIKKLQFKLNSSSNFLSPKFSIHPEGSDLPEEKFILQYFYNLGVQYQLMRSHGSNWKDVLPNSCPPLYHDNNYHPNNPMVPILFRDSAGVYFSQDVILPNYYYDMAMLPFIQGYLPSIPYGMQSESMVVQNLGKFKDEHDMGKSYQFGDFSSNTQSEHVFTEKSSLGLNTRIGNDVHRPKPLNVDNPNLQNVQLFNQKNPQDNPQSDPNSWPQPGGNKNVDNVSWIHNINESQRPAYSNALKKGTASKQSNYTAERTIYASTQINNAQISKTHSKRMNQDDESNTHSTIAK